MQRRNFIQSSIVSGGALLTSSVGSYAQATKKDPISPKLKITKIRYYAAPGYTKPLFNQARGAQMMIGEDQFRIEHLWQYLY